MDRTTLVTGPSKNSFNSASFFAQKDFEIKIGLETLNIETSAHGIVDQRAIETSVECDIIPDGRWTAAMLAAIWNPYANMVVGASMLTGTDLPFVASAADGQIHTIKAACISKLPDIILSGSKTIIGSMTVSGYRAKALSWEDADSLYTIADTGGSFVDATFDPLDIIVQPNLAAWGTVDGFDSFETEDGWTISFDLQSEEKSIDSVGKLDRRFKSLSVMAKCVPVGPTAAQILAAMQIQGGLSRGRSLQDDGSGGVQPDLVISGADGIDYVTIKAAGLKTAGYRFGATTLRAGEIGFVAARTFDTGVQQPLFVLAAS